MRPLVPTGTNRLSSLSSSTIRIETPRPGRPAALGAFVLLQHGYPASSVAAIARTAGFTTGAFYANFGSKAALTLEVLIDLQAEMQAEVAALVSANFDVDTIEGLREWSTRILDSGWPRLQLEFALAIRDGGCLWPECDRPPSWTEAHHIDRWSDGGRTDLDRGVLLCRHHHLRLHNEGWTIHTRAGRYWLHPPPGTDRPGALLVTKSRAIREHLARRSARVEAGSGGEARADEARGGAAPSGRAVARHPV